jgi:hypothetical protein
MNREVHVLVLREAGGFRRPTHPGLVKQNLKIKTFVGTTSNAVKTQVWTALITMLMLRFMQLKSQWGWSLSNSVALLRMNLFTHRDLWAWLNNPLGVPPDPGVPQQVGMRF